MKYNKIILIGMMGSGKTTISKILSKNLDMKLFELDEIFEQKEKISIKDFFLKHGEEEFRKKETNILKESLNNEKIIISTGGGIISKKENRALIFQKNILTIYLKTHPKTIYDRIKNETNRPLLLVKNPQKEIENLLSSREEFYNLATITIDTENKTKEEVAKEIEKWIK